MMPIAMPGPRIFLLRHGQSSFNAAWESRGLDPNEADARLTHLGWQQAFAIAAHVRALNPQLLATSPATRCIETTLAVFPEPDARPPVYISPLIRDRFSGDSCDYGRSPAELQREFPAFEFSHVPDGWWLPEGQSDHQPAIESRPAFMRRIDRLRSWLWAREEGGAIVVVGHEGTFRELCGLRLRNSELQEWTRP
jgi:broad specificity phosphatase PhoE